MTSTGFRKLLSSAFVAFCALSVLIALIPLAFILFFVVTQGIRAVNLEFFTRLPRPVGEPGGGMANAIVGTLIVTGLASLMAVPIGIVSGIYMSEYAGTRFASTTRFAADTLNGVPSIVIGVFAYGVMVLPAALPGIVTGVVLALARIAGETAPLLFTSFNNRFFTTKLNQPISTLTVQVFTYATGPYEDWHRQAWAGALVLVMIVLVCSLLARFATRRLERMHARS